MGNELVSDLFTPMGVTPNGVAPISYTDIFHEHLPFYMSIGMSYDEFYNGDVELCRYYLKAFKMKQKRENNLAWLQGAYFYEALLCASPVFHDFAKHPKPIEYRSEPYPIDEEEKEKRDAQEQEKSQIGVMAKFESFVAKANKQFKEKESEVNGDERSGNE